MNARSTTEGRPTDVERGLASQPQTGRRTPPQGGPAQLISDAAIWVFRSDRFAFSRTAANGWETSYGFETLQQLAETLTTHGHAQRKINRLGICAHGNRGGIVEIARSTTLTAANVSHPAIAPLLRALEQFLTRDARVIFFSCAAGQGPEGTQLLSNLSRLWPGRTVVGFTTFGYIDTSLNAPNAPGNVADTGDMNDGRIGAQVVRSGQRRERMDENAPTAKWVRSGSIIRSPLVGI